MKKLTLISLMNFICLLTLSFAHAENRFEGLWQEISLYDDSDIIKGSDNGVSVDDSEYYYISSYQNKLLMNNVNKGSTFAVGEVKQNTNILKFVVVNYLDRDDIYVLNYECREKVKNLELRCQFTNQKGEVEKNIIWKKRTQKMTQTK